MHVFSRVSHPCPLPYTTRPCTGHLTQSNRPLSPHHRKNTASRTHTPTLPCWSCAVRQSTVQCVAAAGERAACAAATGTPPRRPTATPTPGRAVEQAAIELVKVS